MLLHVNQYGRGEVMICHIVHIRGNQLLRPLLRCKHSLRELDGPPAPPRFLIPCGGGIGFGSVGAWVLQTAALIFSHSLFLASMPSINRLASHMPPFTYCKAHHRACSSIYIYIYISGHLYSDLSMDRQLSTDLN